MFKSSVIVSRSFNSSSKWGLFSFMVCSMCCNGVSGIDVSLPSFDSVVLLRDVGSITGITVCGGGIGVPATAVPCFPLILICASSD